MKSVYLINGGMDADAFGILSGTCEKELARRGVKRPAVRVCWELEEYTLGRRSLFLPH